MSGENEQSNICSICGGVIRLEYVIEFVKAVPHSMRIEPPSSKPFRVCFGHAPEQDNQHDGNLDKDGHNTVKVRPGFHDVFIEGTYGSVVLAPADALSLLRWLLQERPHLEALAKE